MNNNFSWWVVNSPDFIYFATSNPVEERQGWQIVWIMCNVFGPYLESWRKSWLREKIRWHLHACKELLPGGKIYFQGSGLVLMGFRMCLGLTDRSSGICLVPRNKQASKGPRSPLWDRPVSMAKPTFSTRLWPSPDLSLGGHWAFSWESCRIKYRTPS